MNTVNTMDILQNIKTFRKKAGLTQATTAEKMNMAQQNYALVESGKTELTYSKIQKLAEIFGVSVGELLGLEGVQAVPNGEQARENEALKKEVERLQREVQDLREMKEGLEILIKAQVSKLPNEELKKNALVGSAMGAILALGTYLEFHFNELKERGFDFPNEKPKGKPPEDLLDGWEENSESSK